MPGLTDKVGLGRAPRVLRAACDSERLARASSSCGLKYHAASESVFRSHSAIGHASIDPPKQRSSKERRPGSARERALNADAAASAASGAGT